MFVKELTVIDYIQRFYNKMHACPLQISYIVVICVNYKSYNVSGKIIVAKIKLKSFRNMVILVAVGCVANR